MIPAAIEPATFRFVAQHLNHCATAVLKVKYSRQVVEYLKFTLNVAGNKRFS